MTIKHQPEPSDAPVSSAVVESREITAGASQPRMNRRGNVLWTAEKLHGVRRCVVERLFGKRHWATKWAIDLCGADSRFLFHLAEQRAGYAHFLCLLRLALLEHGADDGDARSQARLIRTESKKALLRRWFPSCPAGTLNLLPKLPPKPLTKQEYRQLIRALARDDMRKDFHHARRVRKWDIRVIEMMDGIPEKFRCGAVMRCVRNQDDFECLCICARGVQLLGIDLQITEREISQAAAAVNDMSGLSKWFSRKFAEIPFPPPPWDGDDSIRPVRDRSALKATAERFNNCVMRYVNKVVFGFCYLYICESTPAVIELVNDRFFGWQLREINGVANKQVTRAQDHAISQSFSAAGFYKEHDCSRYSRHLGGAFLELDL
ncbi:MAG: hypothetical protein ACR2P7_02965 [bacterium]